MWSLSLETDGVSAQRGIRRDTLTQNYSLFTEFLYTKLHKVCVTPGVSVTYLLTCLGVDLLVREGTRASRKEV